MKALNATEMRSVEGGKSYYCSTCGTTYKLKLTYNLHFYFNSLCYGTKKGWF